MTALNEEQRAWQMKARQFAQDEKLTRDAIIWTHLAGDASQRLKVIRRLAKA
jgi:hypothetical protein